MKVVKIEAFPINIAYKRVEKSALIYREGVSDVIVKITADTGLVGWGEACMNCETTGIEKAVLAVTPFLIGRSPWDTEAIARDYFIKGGWQFQPMTGNFAFAGIDMALWDLCGKMAGQPIYKFFGGLLNPSVDYMNYLLWGTPDDVAAQCRQSKAKGYRAHYFKVGVDTVREEELLHVIRSELGPEAKIRIDPNQAWTVPYAVATINRWHEMFDLDFVEAPVPVEPIDLTLDVKSRVTAPLAINEGLWKFSDVVRIINSRAADYLTFSPYWVGSLRRFHTAIHLAHHAGQLVNKHTHGEFGIAAAACQHMMLAAPNLSLGNQQTAQMMADDILVERIPIMDGPAWGVIDKPGLGIEIDEDKLHRFHEDFRRDGEYPPYGRQYGKS